MLKLWQKYSSQIFWRAYKKWRIYILNLKRVMNGISRCTKLYHVTKKSTYENVIKKEGLKPICEREKKNFPCSDWLHFTLDRNEADLIGVDIFPHDDWIVLQTDIVEVLNKCKFLHKYEYYSGNEVIATSKWGETDLTNMVGWHGQKYDCIISPSRLKVVFDSNKVKTNKKNNNIDKNIIK